ncbi:MAG: PfkB family carbohydrate kinase [Kiritimatiellia bacterium]
MKKSTAAVQLVIVGSIGLDTIATPKSKRARVLGGSVTHACAAASFFAKTGMVGVVGTDFPSPFLELYRQIGLDVEGLQRVKGRTFRWSGIYEEDMNNRRTLKTELNVLADFAPLLPEGYRKAPFLFLANMQPGLQLRVLDQMQVSPFTAADTMDLWIRECRAEVLDVLKRVNMVTLNDSEARQLTGESNLIRAAAGIRKMGPPYVVIKKGEHGAMLFSRDGMFLLPAFPVENVVDPTGAGDTFTGGLLGALAGGGQNDDASIRRALMHGAVMASFCVESFGPDGVAGLTSAAIGKRLLSFQKMLATRGDK